MNIFQIDGIEYFLMLLPIVAFLYASVGHGGASGYLALMAIWAFPVSVMKPTALVLNLFVAAVSFIAYARKGHFNWKLFTAFALASIPMAFLGGMIEIDAPIYKKVLAVLLVFAVLKLLGVFGKESDQIKDVPFWQGLLVGAAIGFFSGMIGIGGGIILSPIILIMRWGTMKQAAAVSAAFIWVNSNSRTDRPFKSRSNHRTSGFFTRWNCLDRWFSGWLFWKSQIQQSCAETDASVRPGSCLR